MRELYTLNQRLAWRIGYIAAHYTDNPNFIFAIKQGGMETTFEIYNSLLAQGIIRTLKKHSYIFLPLSLNPDPG